jgi:predicted ABC-class ATPase
LPRASLLRERLHRIDGKGYKAYRSITGEYDLGTFQLYIDHVQADPFAPPSLLRARVAQEQADFPPELYRGRIRSIALADLITRQFAAAITKYVGRHGGTGGSGSVDVDEGGQEVLERTSCIINDRFAELRFSVGLPAAGRRCLGQQAASILLQKLPPLVNSSLVYAAYDPLSADMHIAAAEDQEGLREQLARHKLVAFVANGSVLPRASGISDKPLSGSRVISFTSPKELEVELVAPNRGKIPGMGIPEGITLIIGGGYHGKSTLLSALSRSVYNHVPGDGREKIVCRPDAVWVRAEDGRRIEKVNISPFLSELPSCQDTRNFQTDNASGSTSQAANIVEAVEYGTSLLLMDEDTCATNLMVRDRRMQQLVPKEKEPITPFLDQVRNLYEEHGISTIIVTGGCSDYFEVADTVIGMDCYLPRVLTEQAKRLTEEQPSLRANESHGRFDTWGQRIPMPGSLQTQRRGRTKVTARTLRTIHFGYQTVDLDALEQLVDPSQTRAIGDMLVYCLRCGYVDGKNTLSQVMDHLFADVDGKGLDVISPFWGQHPGNYARPRRQEVAAALNRLRSLAVDTGR